MRVTVETGVVGMEAEVRVEAVTVAEAMVVAAMVVAGTVEETVEAACHRCSVRTSSTRMAGSTALFHTCAGAARPSPQAKALSRRLHLPRCQLRPSSMPHHLRTSEARMSLRTQSPK